MPPEELVTIQMMSEEFDIPIETMRRWSDTDRKNGFPEPVERLGKVRFYQRTEAERWVALYSMVHRKNKAVKKNGQRSTS